MTPLLAQAGSGGSASTISFFWSIGLIIAVWYFLVFRPTKTQEQKRRAMLGGLKTGDRVITNGGIHGQITQLGESTVKLRVADNVRIEFSRSAIAGLQSDGAGAGEGEKGGS